MKVPDEIKRRDPISLLPRKLNEVIRYLRAARLVAGPGVRLRESTSGTTMTVETQPSGGSGDSGGEFALGVLVSGPSGGYGPAVWRAITVNPDGTWTATGEEVPVIVPLLK